MPQTPLQPLATLAALKGHGEILQLCLEEGAIFDINLDKAAKFGAPTHPAMLNTLLAVNWRDIQHSQEALDELVWVSLSSSDVTMLTWVLEHGGQVTTDTARLASLPGRPISQVALLLERCGITPFKGWGGLQLAVGRGDLDKVKLFLAAGADVEEMPNVLDIREPGPYTALYEAVKGQHVEMVRLLLEHGAKVDTPCSSSKETPLELARQLGNRQVLDLLE